MFGIGGRAYTRSIERELNVNFDQAEELKVGLSSERVPRAKVPAVELALGKTVDVWMSGVDLALGEFDKLDHLRWWLKPGNADDCPRGIGLVSSIAVYS